MNATMKIALTEGQMPAHKGTQNCTVCRHTERVRLELLLAGGASQASVSAKYGLSKFSVHRHWANHVSPERKAALIVGPVQREALAARVAEESSSVIDHHRVVRAGLYALYDSAVTAGDGTTGALLAGRLIEINNSIGKLMGQLVSSPLVQNNTINYFASDPAFGEFQAKLISILRPFPDARRAVIAAFESVETPAARALPAPINGEVIHDVA